MSYLHCQLSLESAMFPSASSVPSYFFPLGHGALRRSMFFSWDGVPVGIAYSFPWDRAHIGVGFRFTLSFNAGFLLL